MKQRVLDGRETLEKPLILMDYSNCPDGPSPFRTVPGNRVSLCQRFRERLSRYWPHVLKRRSQKGRLGAARATRLCNRWLPHPGLVHPCPEV
jgi:hypothetical protein